MRILAGLLGLTISFFVGGAIAAECGPNALGTSRTITIDAAKHRFIKGDEKHLGLRDKEVILTFDDGPIAGKTPRVLKALKKECVKATFFYVGKMARAYPKLVKRVVAHGHTLAHHTHDHNRLPKYSIKRAASLIEKGVSDLQKIAYGDETSTPRIPFFRYPYLDRNKETDRMLEEKGLVAFGTNIDASDWKRNSPSTIHNRIMRRVRKQGRGIILMHDIHNRTARMLPRLLRSLKREGYKVVHMVPKGHAVPKPAAVAIAALDKPQTKTGPAAVQAEKTPKRKSVVSAAQQAAERAVFPEIDDRLRTTSENAAKRFKDTVRTGVTVGGTGATPPPVVPASLATSPNPVESSKARKPSVRLKRKAAKAKPAVKKSLKTSKKLFAKRRLLVAKAGKRTIKIRRSQWILR